MPLRPYAAPREVINIGSRRNIPIQFYVNGEEKKQIDDLQNKTGLSISKLMRSLISGRQLRERIRPDYWQLVRSIDRIGNNINQIAYKCNRASEAGQEDIKEAVRLVRQVRNEVEHWEKS